VTGTFTIVPGIGAEITSLPAGTSALFFGAGFAAGAGTGAAAGAGAAGAAAFGAAGAAEASASSTCTL
ncbi:MAG TPA: hypothetical protein DEB16_03900, partial [Ruminococcaceae bacterium]|nr:hypothetical protein [Oscillospiraceae bacterium]